MSVNEQERTEFIVKLERELDEARNEIDDAREAMSDYSINIANVPLAPGIRELVRRADDFMSDAEKFRQGVSKRNKANLDLDVLAQVAFDALTQGVWRLPDKNGKCQRTRAAENLISLLNRLAKEYPDTEKEEIK